MCPLVDSRKWLTPRYASGMAEGTAVSDKDPERRRAAVEKFKKHKGTGAGSGTAEALESQRSLAGGLDGLNSGENVESAE